jgi:hypothetical protein
MDEQIENLHGQLNKIESFQPHVPERVVGESKWRVATVSDDDEQDKPLGEILEASLPLLDDSPVLLMSGEWRERFEKLGNLLGQLIGALDRLSNQRPVSSSLAQYLLQQEIENERPKYFH